MQYMGLNEIREKYLSFFESKRHLRLPSFPLVPQNDKSILLINAGMTPLKPYFTGEQNPPSKRVTTCQKCIRTPDIERIGKTERHATFFEMLGNFSFGDYFKKEVIPWAWEFFTEVMKLPKDRLYVSVFFEDDEAYDIWTKDIGIEESHIARMGKEDNFWEHGEGPCGPCSEIFFDRGTHKSCNKPDCKFGCDCDRFIEVWNLVFTQFNNDGNGNYTKLKSCNIDTGMGLERLACVMQEVDSLFDVDTIKNITARLSEMTDKKYGQSHETDISLRIVTDHIRSTTFLVSDGVLPSNEGRGYVLRRLLRRAARHGKLLGIKSEHFLSELADVVIAESCEAYSELREKASYIKTIIEQEESRFNQTIDSGLVLLSNLIEKAKSKGENFISGEDCFRLYDTFGFPYDLTEEILEENAMSTDKEAFDACMNRQKALAKQAHVAAEGSAWKGNEALFGLSETEFLGYDTLSAEAKVVKVITEDGKTALILDKTPFYGESGGQIGDRGTISKGDFKIEIKDCKKINGIVLHHCGSLCTEINEGDSVLAEVCAEKRGATMRNHSSAHLLQAALKNVLGEHIAQAGSFVDEHRMRFDFSHFAAMTADEIKRVEKEINENILKAHKVIIKVMGINEAKETGALALFGEKYGETVRVVTMGDVSVEFCGGTHVSNTSQIGLFKIISETGIAAGVRRIEALTGLNILNSLYEKEALISSVSAALKANPNDLLAKAEALTAEIKTLNKHLDELDEKLSSSKIEELAAAAESINNFKFIHGVVGEAKVELLRKFCDNLKDKYSDAVILFANVSEDKVNFVIGCGKDAVKNGAHGGNLVKEAARICLGGGGGRPDSATAGGKDATKLPEAFAAVKAILQSK